MLTRLIKMVLLACLIAFAGFVHRGLEGKRFAFVDPKSASSYVYPRAMLIEKGVSPERYFRYRDSPTGTWMRARFCLTT